MINDTLKSDFSLVVDTALTSRLDIQHLATDCCKVLDLETCDVLDVMIALQDVTFFPDAAVATFSIESPNDVLVIADVSDFLLRHGFSESESMRYQDSVRIITGEYRPVVANYSVSACLEAPIGVDIGNTDTAFRSLLGGHGSLPQVFQQSLTHFSIEGQPEFVEPQAGLRFLQIVRSECLARCKGKLWQCRVEFDSFSELLAMDASDLCVSMTSLDGLDVISLNKAFVLTAGQDGSGVWCCDGLHFEFCSLSRIPQ